MNLAVDEPAERSASQPPGLSTAEARLRLADHGPNDLVPPVSSHGALDWLRRVVTDPMVALLLVAGAVYLSVGDFGDAAVSMIALVAITAVSVVLELRTERALDALKQLTSPVAAVWRDGQLQTIATNEIVPGDRLLLREGDVVPADAKLAADGRLMVDESSLTGESHPADKERGDAAWAGTTVLSGRAEALVVETGARTRYGKIGVLVAGITEPPTPLQRGIRRFVSAWSRGSPPSSSPRSRSLTEPAGRPRSSPASRSRWPRSPKSSPWSSPSISRSARGGWLGIAR